MTASRRQIHGRTRSRFTVAGQPDGLIGEYPVWTTHPPRAHNVPAVITRTHHEAVTGSGPAIVDVPIYDRLQPAEDRRDAAALGVRIGGPALGSELEELTSLLNGARRPAIIVGSAADGRVPARVPLSFLCAAAGGLGFGLPADMSAMETHFRAACSLGKCP